MSQEIADRELPIRKILQLSFSAYTPTNRKNPYQFLKRIPILHRFEARLDGSLPRSELRKFWPHAVVD